MLTIDPYNIAGATTSAGSPAPSASNYNFSSGGSDFNSLLSSGGVVYPQNYANSGLTYQGTGTGSPAITSVLSDTDTDTKETPPTEDELATSANASALAAKQANLGDYLRRINTTKEQGLQGIGDDYNKEVSDANLNRSRTLDKFGMQRADTELGRDTTLGKVNTNARTLANSVQRILGMASGSGSSAYKLAAPNAIARDTSAKRGEVMSDFGQNFRDLAYAEDNAKTDFERMLAEIEDQKKSRERSFLGEVGSQEQQAYADAGDNFNVDRVQGELDGLFQKYRTPYSVTPVNTVTPQLRDYTTDRTAVQANQTQGQDVYSPYQPLRKKFENQVA